MALAAAQVVEQIAARLSGATAAATRVYTRRGWPIDAMPAWRVQISDEPVITDGLTYPAVQRHELTVDLVGYLDDAAYIDAAMHSLCVQGLQALFGTEAAATLAPLRGVQLELAGIQRRVQSDGAAEAGRITLQLLATFHTLSNDPTTLI